MARLRVSEVETPPTCSDRPFTAVCRNGIMGVASHSMGELDLRQQA